MYSTSTASPASEAAPYEGRASGEAVMVVRMWSVGEEGGRDERYVADHEQDGRGGGSADDEIGVAGEQCCGRRDAQQVRAPRWRECQTSHLCSGLR